MLTKPYISYAYFTTFYSKLSFSILFIKLNEICNKTLIIFTVEQVVELWCLTVYKTK